MTKTYVVTGGTGSLGSLLTKILISKGYRVRAYARNEHGHEALEKSIPANQRHLLSCLIGSVEDTPRLALAMQGADYAIHAAALKVIGLAEYNPSECVKTNVLGTQSVIQACLEAGVKRAVFVSSDKASASINHYGHTKAVGEKLWIHANRYRPESGPFVAVRYGNCWNSRGSVLQAWKAQHVERGYLTLTSPECTRFHWKLEDAAAFVLKALHEANPGEIWIPKLPSYKLEDLVHAFGEVYPFKKPCEVVGLRPGEKLHESMLSQDEAFMCRNDGTRLVLTPGVPQGVCMTTGYNSGSNTWRIGRRELEELVRGTE